MTVGRVLGKGGEALQLAIRLVVGFLREVCGLHLFAQLVGLALSRVTLPDLGLNLAHATAQHAFAPLRIELFGFGFVAQSLLRLRDRHLAIEVAFEALQPRHRVDFG